MPKITQLTLKSINITGSVYYIRDNDIKGLAIKVTAKGQASFVVEGRIKRGGMVDTRDLKSLGLIGRASSSLAVGTR